MAQSTSGMRWRGADGAAATAERTARNTALGYPKYSTRIDGSQGSQIANSCHIWPNGTDISELDGYARAAGFTRVNASGTAQLDRLIDMADQTPLWLVGLRGQSNANGNSGLPKTLVDLVDVSTAIQWKQGNTGLSDQIETANEPLHHSVRRVDEIGPFVAFARALIAGGLVPAGHRVCLVPSAVSNTGMVSGGGRWSVGGDLHETYVTRLLAAKAAFPGSVLGCDLMHQGEHDGNAGTAAATYRAAHQATVADIRSRLGNATAPHVCGGLAPDYTGSNAGVLAIHNELANVAANISNSAFASSAGLSTIDGVHFDAASYRTLGARYSAALDTLI